MALRRNEDGMAAIHYAVVRKGSKDIVSCLIDYVPDCTEVFGKNNKNALHFALDYRNIRAAKILLFKSINPSFLINHADNDGHTAFHKAVEDPELACDMISPMLKISRWNVNAADNNGLTTLNVVKARLKCGEKPYRNQLKKCGAHRKARINRPLSQRSGKIDGKVKKDDVNNLSVIATLIFTVTFAAALTVPGGFRSDNGVPVRMYSIAFQCFLVSDTLAFCFSILAMFMLTIKSIDEQELSAKIQGFILFREKYYRGYLSFIVGNKGFSFNGLNMVYNAINATIISFLMGVYVTVAFKCLWLALTVCTMGVFTYFIYLFIFNTHSNPTLNQRC